MTTKRTAILALALGCMMVSALQAEPGQHQHQGKQERQSQKSKDGQAKAKASAPAPERQPMVINMTRSSSGGHNRNFPSQEPAAAKPAPRPSWGQGYQPSAVPQARPGRDRVSHGMRTEPSRPAPAAPQAVGDHDHAGQHNAIVPHRHPYTVGYVRQKLQKLGVKTEPAYISDRAEIIHTDLRHSTIAFPSKGPDDHALNAKLIRPRGDDAVRVREHMGLVSRPDWRERVEAHERDETRPGRYYWHKDSAFNYCHYLDDSGYHWYGWYLGPQFFWTRNFSGRWWWYDVDFDRWSFYNDNFWWWQDPYHVGDLYCYNDGAYIPVNSQEDQIVVTQAAPAELKSFKSPDGTRTVKLLPGSEDAFLYDTDGVTSFNPVYLASGVERVEFSNTANGRPLEIVLKLNDGSFDLFDGDGHPFNLGSGEPAPPGR